MLESRWEIIMKKILILSLVFCGSFLFIGGCSRNISSSTYDSKEIGSVNETYECTVVNVRRVVLEEGDYLEDNKVGAIVGAATGGVLGNTIGKGTGRTAATVLGAVAGGFGGAMAEKALKKQEGVEYVVKLQSGSMRTVVQGADNPLSPGQKALLIVDKHARSRIVPAQY
jgi:outer membrane lipoprotein SlyB